MRLRLMIFGKGLVLIAAPLLLQWAFLGLVAYLQRTSAEAQLAALRSGAADARADRERILQDSWRQMNGLLVGGGAGALVTTALLTYLFSHGISGRIAALTDNAQRLARAKELAPRMTGDDEIARLDEVFHDMARSLAEAGQRELAYRHSLEALVAERTAELAETNRQLRLKNEENEVFVASVSHDLRSPLVNLQGFSKELEIACRGVCELLSDGQVAAGVCDRVHRLLDGEVRECLGYIQAAVARMSRIIDALLRLSRAGRVEYDWQPVDMRPLVARVVASMSATIAERGATVRLNDLPPVWGDATALEQVFANLLANAVTYLDPGRPGVVEVGSRDTDGADGLRTLYVRDNGLGIAEAMKGRLFRPFQRFHPGVAPGEGIGLALVRRIVERHRGTIRVESAAGVGSEFVVALPAANGAGGREG